MIGSRVSSEINSSSIFESKNSTALFTDSLDPLAAKDAKKGSANLSEIPASETISFDVIPETLRITNLEFISVDSLVNLERSLKFGDEVGGHILSGHISCRAPSRLIRKINEVELVIECPKEWSSYILHKGYVAINGASLTVAKKQEGSFSVYLIP